MMFFELFEVSCFVEIVYIHKSQCCTAWITSRYWKVQTP